MATDVVRGGDKVWARPEAGGIKNGDGRRLGWVRTVSTGWARTIED
jgi:hypothetical protein